VRNLHYDDRKPILAKNLIQGKTFISKLFFVFNINDALLHDNQDYHNGLSPMSSMGLQNPYIGMQDPSEFSLIGDTYIPHEDADESMDPFSPEFYDPSEVSRIKDNISQIITDGGQSASIYEDLFDSN